MLLRLKFEKKFKLISIIYTTDLKSYNYQMGRWAFMNMMFYKHLLNVRVI